MNGPHAIEEMLELIDRCLATADWDRLGQLQPPDLTSDMFSDRTELQAALDRIELMQARLHIEMDTTARFIEEIPTVRKASKTYLGF